MDEARVEAEAARSRRGVLAGVPIAVKDIFDTAGIPTECGTALMAGRVPERSATVVSILEEAGAVVFGKTVTAELAYAHPGPTRNPWDLQRTPGGSSMGSAAAVAAGVVPGAIGTQTNGSIIRPAAFTGVVGFKPSAGRIPREGVLSFSPTLDQVGVLAADVGGAALLAGLLMGESMEPARLVAPRLLVVRTSDWRLAEPAQQDRFDADLALLARSGAVIEERELPLQVEEGPALHRTIMAREASAELAGLVEGREDQISDVLKALLADGKAVSAPEYEAALVSRLLGIARWGQWLEGWDAVLTPPALGEAPGADTTGDPRFCTRWSLLGAPAISIPTGYGPRGLPLGIQVVGRPGDDGHILSIAAWIEAQLMFRHRPLPF
jgi:Asp-tRNA(Asn)/Glu-tRNA(Gln) amidotransferase A subunit family amidase